MRIVVPCSPRTSPPVVASIVKVCFMAAVISLQTTVLQNRWRRASSLQEWPNLDHHRYSSRCPGPTGRLPIMSENNQEFSWCCVFDLHYQINPFRRLVPLSEKKFLHFFHGPGNRGISGLKPVTYRYIRNKAFFRKTHRALQQHQFGRNDINTAAVSVMPRGRRFAFYPHPANIVERDKPHGPR